MIRNLDIRLCLFALCVALCSCVANQREIGGKADGNGEKGSVVISMKLPAVANPGTRALTDADESAVKTVDVLVFDNTNKFCDSGVGMIQSQTGNVAKFTTRLAAGTNRRVVLMINASDAIGAAYPNSIPIGTSIDEVRQKIVMTLPAGGWNNDPAASDYKGIPMTGEVVDKTIGEGVNLHINSVRSLSRVNVALGADIAEATFKMTDVRVYNYNGTAAVLPSAAAAEWWFIDNNPAALSPTVPTQNIVKGPITYSTMTTPDRAMVNSIYMFEAVKGKPYSSTNPTEFMKNPCLVIGGVYGTMQTPTYYRVDFVRKLSDGTYEYLDILRNYSYNVTVKSVGGPGKSTPEEAFNSVPENIEADILKWNDSDIGQIVFNGQYMLGVSQTAFKLQSPAQTANLKITTDVPAVGTAPGGWQATVYDDEAGTSQTQSTWLTMDTYSGGSNAPTGIWTKLKLEQNNTNAVRTAYIHITADRLTMIVKVTQTLENTGITLWNASSDFASDRMEFSDVNRFGEGVMSNDNMAFYQFFNIRVKWEPATSPVTFSVVDGATPFPANVNGKPYLTLPTNTTTFQNPNGDVDYRTVWNPATYDVPKGEWYFEFSLKALPLTGEERFDENSVKLNFSLMTQSGQTVSKSTSFILRRDDIEPNLNQYSQYLMDGTKYTIPVKANFPWRVKLLSDANGVLAPDPVTGGVGFQTQYGGDWGKTNDSFSFSLINNIKEPVDHSKLKGTIKFAFERKVVAEDGTESWVPWCGWMANTPGQNQVSPGTAPKEYSIECVAALPVGVSNCYMVKPNGAPIMIPLYIIEEAQGHLGVDLMNNTDQFSARFLWSDKKTGVVKDIRAVGGEGGKGYNGHLIVIPGSEDGNVIVAVYNETTGHIAWSWHIWVTGYDPGNGGKTYTNTPTWSDNGLQRSQKLVWMDRNLGALKAIPDDAGAQNGADIYGFYYQYGRKDPFPGPQKWPNAIANNGALMTGNTLIDRYDWRGNKIPYKSWPNGYASGMALDASTTRPGTTPAAAMTASIKNPMLFYGGAGTNEQIWMGADNQEYAAYLKKCWIGTDGVALERKGLLDPCPEGWRLPSTLDDNPADKSPWVDVTEANAKAAPQQCTLFNGNNGSELLGYWPRMGLLHVNWVSNGKPVYEYGSGNYWSGAKGGTTGYGRRLRWGHVYAWHEHGAFSTDFGYSVRCVKDY